MSTALPQTIGRYRVVGALGEGAMGEVVRARDERLGREVAIKRVKNPGGEGAAEFAARFEAEARALAALAHPGVVQIFELGIDGDEPYLVMELVDGQSLRAVIKERAPLPEAEVRAMGIQLARALEAAHARGILHRDVKPANVLRATGGSAGAGWKLADFGVAQLPDSEMTSTGQFIGTPAYAAPEALALAQFSPASDVYGLAATLVEAASGKRPRKDATLAELMAKSQEGASLEGVPDELAAILRPALALDARARPSAGELAELLAGSPETGQILQAMAARAKSGPAFVSAGEQDTRVGGARRKNPEGSQGASAPVMTVGVPDDGSRAAATAALRGAPGGGFAAGSGFPAAGAQAGAAAGAHAGGGAERALQTVAVPDETRARAVSEPGRMPTPLPMQAQLPTPLPMQAQLPAFNPMSTATAAAAVAVPGPAPAASARRMTGKQMLAVGAALIVVIAVISRACSEKSPSGALPFPASATTPGGGEPSALPPHLQAEPGYEEPLRFDMPAGLDRKSAQAWAEVARAVNEGKLKKALDRLQKLEERAGESAESAKLRAWLEEHADEEDDEGPARPPGPPGQLRWRYD